MLRVIARVLGFFIGKIVELPGPRRNDRRGADVKARVRGLRHKIAHLQELTNTLEDLADACARN